MTAASEDLLRAVLGLRRAAEAHFSGNTYYRVANEIGCLIEHLGGCNSGIPAGQNAVYGYATMLSKVYKAVEANYSGNEYYMLAHRLDRLELFMTPGAAVPPAKAPAAVQAATDTVAAAPAALAEHAAAGPTPVVEPTPAVEPAPAQKTTAAPLAQPVIVSAPEAPPEPASSLLQLSMGLRKSAEAQFTGNAYYKVTQEIGSLIELIGGNAGSTAPGQAAVYGFATMLSKVSRAVDAETTGERHHALRMKLSRISAFLRPVEAHRLLEARPSFASLAGASKHHAEEVAHNLGVVPGHQAAQPHQESEAESVPAGLTAGPAAQVAPAEIAEPVAEATVAPAGPAEEPAVQAAPAAQEPTAQTPAPGSLLQLALGLRKAAEAQFTGNAYYQVKNEIKSLIELIGGSDGTVAPGQAAVYGFATMLSKVSRAADAETSGARHHAIKQKLEGLFTFLKPVPAAPLPEHRPNFAGLAEASKHHVEEVAHHLGVVPAHHAAPPHHEAETAPVMEEPLEKRSSEPCLMPEVTAPEVTAPEVAALPEEAAAAPHAEISADAPPSGLEAKDGAAHAAGAGAHPFAALSGGTDSAAEDTGPAPIERRLERRSSENANPLPARTSEQTDAAKDQADGPAHLGPQAAESAVLAETDAAAPPAAAPGVTAPAPAQAGVLAAPAAPAIDPAPLAAQGVLEPSKQPQARRPAKTLFKLWLDMAFGRKD